MNEAQQVDLLDLELSHEDDVSKPVSNDDGLFFINPDDENQPLTGNNTMDNHVMSNNDTSINIGSIGNNNLNDSNTPSNDIDAANAKCWNLQYYQPYFDIDTNQELYRLRKALLPFRSGEFFDKELGEKPDLLSVNIIFLIFTQIRFL